MLLQIVTTYVDEKGADVSLWDVEATKKELEVISKVAKRGLPDPDEGEEPLLFRGVEYTTEYHDLDSLLRVIGKPVVVETINVYVY